MLVRRVFLKIKILREGLLVCDNRCYNDILFNIDNLNEIMIRFEKRKQLQNRSSKSYTMVQLNSPCKVEISEKSKNICADALMK